MSEPKGRGADWTQERGTSDEGRRRPWRGPGRWVGPRRRAGDTAHLDTGVLAEFRAGLITGRRGAKIAGHLAGCDHCAALDDRLAGVSALLASVPAPVMPDSLAQRLDAVLAAEAANRDHPERAGVHASREPGTHRRPARHRGSRLLRMRVLAPAGVAAVVLAAGGYGLSLIGSGPATQAASSSAGGAAKAPSGAYAPTEGPYRASAPTGPQRLSPAMFPVVASGTNYRRGALRQQLTTELRKTAPRPAGALSGQAMACVRLVTPDVNPVFVDSARFEGKPATVIVVPASGGDKVLVTDDVCSATSRYVLYTTTLWPGILAP